ncbi:hypothetical protein P3T76_000036 [Phytophthora citrophthora]|uniref:Uncharacterized protein n=1 Tax=Phytophthora citrophthora TaxID=4793 RepID=A0AAD9H187_9STRA|nr:hypothetical protein P3T76_000036 [Phytophthora citrophthora]
MAIIGIPPRSLYLMEHGLRNFLDREEVRLRLHSRSTFIYLGNTNMFTEMHEFVRTDEQSGGLFDIIATLERGRRRAVDAVWEADIRRSRAIEARKALMRFEHQRIYNHKLDEFFRIEQAHRQALAGQPEHAVRATLDITRRFYYILLQVWWLVRPQVSRELRAKHHGSTSGQSNTELLCVTAQMLQPLE